MPSSPPARIAPPQRTLEADARDVLPRLRGALTRLLQDVCPPADRLRPAAIARTLGLHQTLAWKLAQIVSNPDPLASVQHVPGDGGMALVLKAAATRGGPRESIAAVEEAMADFRHLVESHAGDRRSVQLMLAGLAQHRAAETVPAAGNRAAPPSSPVDVGIRKSGFLCTSYTWGVQARLRLKTAVLSISSDPARFDIASVRGFIGFRRVRTDTPWPISRRQLFDESKRYAPGRPRPIDPASVHDGVPLLGEFCSRPLPALEGRAIDEQQVEHRLSPGPVGDRAAVDVLLGDVLHGAGARWATPDDDWYDNGLQNRTPTELTVIDTFVHRDLWGACPPPRARIVSELGDEPWYASNRSRDETLPCPAAVAALGMGLNACLLPEYRRYYDLMASVFDRLGLRADEFQLYRFRYEYPVLRTAAAVRFQRPSR